jgi:hypothetical protein
MQVVVKVEIETKANPLLSASYNGVKIKIATANERELHRKHADMENC